MAHTLTFSTAFPMGVTCTVNGESVTSPYTLKNGDVIFLSCGMAYELVINDNYVSSETISLSDTDIVVTVIGGGGSN